MSGPYRIERLSAHDRSGFDCGDEALNGYFRERIGQDVRRDLTSAFVAVANQDEAVAGFCTMAADAVDLSELPEAFRRGLPRYPHVPSAVLGRLAVARPHQGRGLGAALIIDAAERLVKGELGVHLLLVEAENDAARDFYLRMDFVASVRRPMLLMMPLKKLVRYGKSMP